MTSTQDQTMTSTSGNLDNRNPGLVDALA